MGVFDGLRVIDLSWGSAGPMTTMLLSDHGADVLRVERPGGEPFAEPDGYPVWHRGKRSAVLDLTTSAERSIFAELAAGADVIVESFEPGVTTRLGISYDDLRAANPGLIYCSITAYGRDNHHAGRPGYDALVAARCGLQWEARGWYGSPMDRIAGRDAASASVEPSEAVRIGADRGGPIFTATAMPSVGVAYLATLGITAALRARQVTGLGQWVETSMLQAIILYNGVHWQRPEHLDAPGYQQGVLDRRQTWSLLRAADGWLCLWASKPDWAIVAGAGDRLERPDPEALAARAAKSPGKEQSRSALEDRLTVIEEAAPIVAKFPAAAWVSLAAKLGNVSCQPIRTPEEALCDPALVAEGAVIEIDDDTALGPLRQAGILFRLADRPASVRGPAPGRGQHTDEIKTGTGRWRASAEAQPVTPAAVAPAPVIPAPVSPAPVTPAPVAPAPVTPAPVTPAPDSGAGPLAGIRVVDFGLAVAGPWAAQMLADLGADVIKVDPPRQAFWLPTHMATGVNRSKRSIGVDMKAPGGTEVAYDLVRQADVVVFNMRPQAAARIGLDYESLRRVNPKIIYCHTRGHEDGPRSLLPGNDQTANALAGTEWEDGGCSNGGRPWFGVTSGGDLGNGFLAAIAVVAALYDRERTGLGQKVDASILNAGLFNNSRVRTTGDERSFDRPRLDAGQLGLSALYRLYECEPVEDQRQQPAWLCLAAVAPHHWDALTAAVPGLAGDARFTAAASRRANDADLAGALAAALRTAPAGKWFEVLDAAGVPCEVCDPTFSQRLFDDQELVDRGWVVGLDGNPVLGHIDMFGAGIEFSGTPTAPKGPPPVMWQHTAEVLTELGYDSGKIDELRASGAILMTPEP